MQIEQKVTLQTSNKWFSAIIVVTCLLIFIWSLITVVTEEIFFFDAWIQERVSVIASDGLRAFFELFTILGDKKGVIPILIVSLLLIWWKTKDYKGMAILTIGVIVVNELNKLFKDLTGRERPMTGPGAESLSFPSGHAMVGLFFYGLLAFLIIQYTKGKIKSSIIIVIASIYIFMLGFSRLVLNYHYPSDVIAGYAAGTICLLLTASIYSWLISRKKNTIIEK